MSDFVWHPTPELVDQANVTRLMQRHGIPSIDALMQRSVAEQEWFWQAIVDDLGIEFETPFTAVRDTSRGIPWTDWYVGGRLNLTQNCLSRARGDIDGDRACGFRALNGLLTAAARRGLVVTALDERNSGDTAGDRRRVVGYGAYALTPAGPPE